MSGEPGSELDRSYPWRRALEALAAPVLALLFAMALFSMFLLALGKSPMTFATLVWTGAFASAFSVQNTLQRAAPLLLTALCVAVPAQLGLVVIGGEAALALGGLAAAAASWPLAGVWPPVVQVAMALAGMLAGAFWIGLAGWLRAARGVNETISSLLLAYIGVALFNHLVEGPLRDPTSLDRPSSWGIGVANMLGRLPGTDLHPGLAVGVLACVLCWFLIERTRWGFAARLIGGNFRAAQLQGLPVARLIVVACLLGGGCAGLAGMIEVAAAHGRANAALLAGYGYGGILIAFLARQNPLAVMPLAALVGGIGAAGGLVQRHMGLPEATMPVLQGFIFVAVLASDTLQGRLAWFQPRGVPG